MLPLRPRLFHGALPAPATGPSRVMRPATSISEETPETPPGAVGSVGVLLTGALGDWIGPREAAMVSMPALLIGTVLALNPRLREGNRN